jgi:hypothetical protein
MEAQAPVDLTSFLLWPAGSIKLWEMCVCVHVCVCACVCVSVSVFVCVHAHMIFIISSCINFFALLNTFSCYKLCHTHRVYPLVRNAEDSLNQKLSLTLWKYMECTRVSGVQ